MRTRWMFASALLALTPAWVQAQAQQPALVSLNAAEFRDKVYACWLGKSIGGTLGMPVEGRREMHNFTFYTPVPTQAVANDDLDLQLLWLKALEERGPRLNARDLGEYWLKFVPVDWNEYGIGKANLRQGFLPPLSGHFRNRWRDSNGALVRSEIWACVAPGCPTIALRYAWEDACVDHGSAEGTWAELFMAAIESAAFVEQDRDRLLAIGLSYIPPDCAVAKSVRTAVDAYKQHLDFKAAREAVVKASASTGWFMAPQNVAFIVLAWLYGEGDFGKSVCAAVNCGDDTDSTGAAIGALFGLLHGTRGIPETWRKPIGDRIQVVAIGGFKPPATLPEFTDGTVRMTRIVLQEHGAPVEITDGPTNLAGKDRLQLVNPTFAKELWARSPYRFVYDFPTVRAALDVLSDPEIEPGTPRPLKLLIENLTPQPLEVAVTWRAPAGIVAAPATAKVSLPAKGHEPVAIEVALTAQEIPGAILKGSVEVTAAGQDRPGVIPFAFSGHPAVPKVSKDDLALARRGAKATSDSELDREPGCTPRAIDGIITAEDDFDAKRWHSGLTPHPHWIAVELPEPKTVARVIVHFADPSAHPVDFEGAVSRDGKEWTTVFTEKDYSDRRRYEKSFGPLELRHFKLTIRRSAHPHYLHAAQIGEIELLPK